MLNLAESAPPLMLKLILAPHHIGHGHCGIDRTRGVFGECGAAGAAEYRSHIAHIGHRHCDALGDGVGVVGLGGGNDNVVNIVAVGIGKRVKVGAADKAHHTTAAVDAELGRVGTAADAVRHRRTGDIGHGTAV